MKKSKIIVIILLIIIFGLVGGIGYFYFKQDTKIFTHGNCGDGICGTREQKDPKTCPGDCENGLSAVEPLSGTEATKTVQGPINIGFTIHFDPLSNYSQTNQSSKATYQAERDNLEWLYNYFESLKKQKGEAYAPHLDLELGGDHAEYYIEDSDGLNLLKNLYATGDHAFGTHFHDAKQLGEHSWQSVDMSTEKNTVDVFISHVHLVDSLIGKIIGSSEKNLIRKASRILVGWIPYKYKYKYAFGEYGATLETGGRTEGFNTFFDHEVHQPFRVSDSTIPLEEDITGEVLAVGGMPNLGSIEEHAGKYQDNSVPAAKRKFLQTYLERLWQSKQGMTPKTWVFSWGEHTGNLYPEGGYRANIAWHYHRDEVEEMVSWLNDNFVARLDENNNSIAQYANVEEVESEFIEWEKSYPNYSSFDYPFERYSWSDYPYELKFLAQELAGTHYMEYLKNYESKGVKIYKLSRCEQGRWEVERETEKSYCTGSLRDIYLVWNEDSETVIDFSKVLSGEINVIMGASGAKKTVNPKTLTVGEEPMVVY